MDVLGAFLLLSISMINDSRARTNMNVTSSTLNVRVSQRIPSRIFSFQKILIIGFFYVVIVWLPHLPGIIPPNTIFINIFLFRRLSITCLAMSTGTFSYYKPLYGFSVFSCSFVHFHAINFGDTTNCWRNNKINFHCRPSIGLRNYFSLCEKQMVAFGVCFSRLSGFKAKAREGQIRIVWLLMGISIYQYVFTQCAAVLLFMF